MKYQNQINKIRTFAVISHPDAGKTTLTEKLLLFAGAIQIAGAVKSNKIKKTTSSDFMEIEKQRGISVSTSVMSFEYSGLRLNLLDTPGHKDFAEDTYRTLTAVDSVILVVDSVKGVEEQTEKLMEVCAMRKTPVIVFVNKLDREGKNPFDLLDEIEDKLQIHVRPLSWPVNRGSAFKGVYNLHKDVFHIFNSGGSKLDKDIIKADITSSELETHLGDDYNQFKNDVELIEGVYDPLNVKEYLKGNLAPVFFGSALNNFGVKDLLDTFMEISPAPGVRPADKRDVLPNESKFSGFVFKIHANIDKRHRDRIAFLRVCSGKFERNKFFKHVRLKKDVRFTNPATFLGLKKEIIEEAFPGDVIGLYDRENFKIGDTLTEGEDLFFKGMPSFSPEIFKEIINTSTKAKQLEKGLKQLTDEGVAQLFTMNYGNKKIIGAVGQLQFDVIKYRLENEYGASCILEPLSFYKACWLTCEKEDILKEFIEYKINRIAYDKDNNPIFFSDSDWTLRNIIADNPKIEFHFTSEFKTDK